MISIQHIRDRFGWKHNSNLSRLFLVLFSGALTVLAFPHEGAYSFLSWVCMAPFVISLHGAKTAERVGLGIIFGCLYILPGQWSGIWAAISSKDWSLIASCLLISLFFSCYVIPFIIYSYAKPFLGQSLRYSVFRQSLFFTCVIAWFPVYFSVTPACMIHDQPLFYQTADFGGMTIVIFTVIFVNISIAELIYFYNQKKYAF